MTPDAPAKAEAEQGRRLARKIKFKRVHRLENPYPL